MFKRGHPQMRIRLPENHWLWDIKNTDDRNTIIKNALNFYENLDIMQKNMEEILNKLNKLDKLEEDLKELKRNGLEIKSTNDDNNDKEKSKEERDIDEEIKRRTGLTQKHIDSMDDMINF